MYSTSTPRRTSSSWTRTAMVLFPEPDSPVNHNTAAGGVRGASDAAPASGAETAGFGLTGR